MQVISDVEQWIYLLLFWGLMVIRAWAFVDSVLRKNAAFTAAGKLTKPAWVVLTLFSLAIGYFLGTGLNIISMILLIVSLVYLTDVRPAVREVSGGSRW